MTTDHSHFMKAALREAQIAFEEDEIPIGAVVVCNNRIIGRGHNMTQKLNDVTAHAEMIAFTAAANHLNSKYLKDCSLYVTLEPCVMCAGAAFWNQLGMLVFGAGDLKRGYQLAGKNILHPATKTISGIEEETCSRLIKEYFKSKRD